MKPILYTALLLATPAISFAQPTITKMENHAIGTVIKQARDTVNHPTPGSAGANQNWNFTTLSSQETITERVVSPSSTIFGSDFPDASYVRISHDGRYSFIQKGATQNYLLGMVDSVNNTSTKYFDKSIYAQTPLTYLSSVTDNYTSLMSAASDTSKGFTQATADGWGTLVLPSGTYNNTIRVKLLIHQVDTLQAGPMTIPSVMDATVYLWYDNQHYSPLMRWDSTHVDYTLGQVDIRSITYLLNETYPVSVKDISSEAHYSATLSNDRLHISGRFVNGIKYNVSLFNLNGQKLQSAAVMANEKFEIPVCMDLASGIYLVSVQAGDRNIETIKVIKHSL